jgi:hypothetical protein
MRARDDLLAFCRWLLKDEYGEGHEEEYVDKYLAEHAPRP